MTDQADGASDEEINPTLDPESQEPNEEAKAIEELAKSVAKNPNYVLGIKEGKKSSK